MDEIQNSFLYLQTNGSGQCCFSGHRAIMMKYSRSAVTILPLIFLLVSCGAVSDISRTAEASYSLSADGPQLRYIEQYSGIAVSERKRSGVPASITLAQGILESGNGMSELAVKANNHFGIKCHDWNGRRMYFDDDRRGECFRKYRTVEESFRDHSDFLRFRDRYKFLFDFNVTDYESWAYGLKKAGYATDPAYPRKLIRLIEDYDLDRFDKASYGRAVSGKRTGKAKAAVDVTEDIRAGKQTRDAGGTVPATPAELETPRPLSDRQGRTMHLSLTRQLYSQNGVPFVYSVEGETYSDIARYYNLFQREILRYNDLPEDTALMPGTIVYLQPKKSRAARQVDKYVAEGGEQLRDISQRFAVKMKSLMKLNGMEESRELLEGEMILLRR